MFADVEMVNDATLLDIICPEVSLAAWASGVAEPTHEGLIERLGVGYIGGHSGGSRWYEGDAVDLELTTGSLGIQDGVGTGTE